MFNNSNICTYSYLFGFIKNNFSTIKESWVYEIKLIYEKGGEEVFGWNDFGG